MIYLLSSVFTSGILELVTFLLEDQVHSVIAQFNSYYSFKHTFSTDLQNLIHSMFFFLLAKTKKEWKLGHLIGWNFIQRRVDVFEAVTEI